MLRRARPALGTFVEIGIADPLTMIEAGPAFDKAFSAIKRVQALMSFHSPDSDISRINQSQGTPVPVSRLTQHILCLALILGKATSERFNCTVGGAVVEKGALPAPSTHNVLPSGTSQDVQIKEGYVTLLRPVWLTLDGIAKGAAVDCAVFALRKAGIHAGWVNAGGDLRTFGGCTLSVAVRGVGGISTSRSVTDCAVATSRVSKDTDNAFPAHVVTERYADEPAFITVSAASAWRADALTKVAAGTSLEERANSIERLKGTLW